MVNIKLQRFLICSKAPRTFEMLAHQYATSNLVRKKKRGGKRKAIHPLHTEVTVRIPKKIKKQATSSNLCNRLNLLWLGSFTFCKRKSACTCIATGSFFWSVRLKLCSWITVSSLLKKTRFVALHPAPGQCSLRIPSPKASRQWAT